MEGSSIWQQITERLDQDKRVNVTSQNRPSFLTNKRLNLLCFLKNVIVKISFVPSDIKNIDITKNKTDKNTFRNLKKIATIKTLCVLALLAFRMPLYGRGRVQDILVYWIEVNSQLMVK